MPILCTLAAAVPFYLTSAVAQDKKIRKTAGGNMTGVANLSVETGAKQLQLLHEFAATIIALLVNSTNPILAETLSRGFSRSAVRSGSRSAL
jgi:hypothetical protein